jgi:hypothetical protein
MVRKDGKDGKDMMVGKEPEGRRVIGRRVVKQGEW